MNRQEDSIGLTDKIQRALNTLYHIRAHIAGINERLTAEEKRVDKAEKRLDRMEQQTAAAQERLGLAEKRLDRTEQQTAAAQERLGLAEKRLDALERENREIREILNFIRNNGDRFIHELIGRMAGNREAMMILNRELSIVPTVWGRQDRLHISPYAAVNPCFFNTNSGEITVGDYTFAGSGVSLLAGSHDYNLTGLPRRDVELTEGCDITVGKGVWLCSECTVLGPCTIGDHAVIAAGAVVVPGTLVPPGSVYGGIPAKEIARLSLREESDPTDASMLAALKRCDHILFTDGWSDKVYDQKLEKTGHLLLKPEGELLISEACRELHLQYHKEDKGETVLSLSGGGVDEVIHLTGETGQKDICLPGSEKPERMTVRALTAFHGLFAAIEARTEDQQTEN